MSPPPTCHLGTRSFASHWSLGFSSPLEHKLFRPGIKSSWPIWSRLPYGRQLDVTFWIHLNTERFTIQIARYNVTKHSKQDVQSVTETPKSARTNGPLTNLSISSKALSKKGRSSSTTETIAHFLRLSYILKFVTFILLDCCAVVDVRLHWDASVLDIKAWNNVL